MGVIKWVGFVLLSGLVGIVLYQVPICNGDSGSKSLKKLILSRDHIDETLRRAGSQAYRDVAKSVPLMLVMAVLARAFPFLPKASRGWAAAGTMMIGAAAATVGSAAYTYIEQAVSIDYREAPDE
jgi:hypothetical protein